MKLSLSIPPPQRAEVAADYWDQSRRPLASLFFVAPWLAVYELGVLILGSHALRNGADVWLRQLLDWLGFGQYLLLPILTIGILLAWHHLTVQPWRVSPKVLYGMLGESLVFAVLLTAIARAHDSLLSMGVGPLSEAIYASIWTAPRDWLAVLIGYLGAGVYEELLFRLMMIPVLTWGLQGCGLTPTRSVIAAIALSSLLFSAAHHIGSEGEPWVAIRFSFRTIAGVFFASLFVYRGFGIAVGAHALYDILVSLL